MTGKLKPYPQYKDSGVSWIGLIPDHWDMRKMRSILSSYSERNRPDLPLLSVVREKGVIIRDTINDDENHNYIPDDLTNYKVVHKGHFAMNKMKAWQGSYGISNYDGIVSPAYYVFSLSGVEPDFFHKTLRSKAFIPFFTQASDGIRVGQWDLNHTRMKEIPFWIPPKEEQLQIARYLDWKTSQINRFIKAKKRLIELLKEQKQVIINDAVTGKIDVRTGKPYPKYKDSGVEWLGQVPEDWDINKLKNIALKIGDGIHTTPMYVDNSEYYFINGNNLIDGKINITAQTKCIDYKEFLKHKIEFKNPTILFSINGTIGNSAFYRNEKVILGKSAAYIEINSKSIAEYLFFYLKCKHVNNYFYASLNGTTINNLSLFTLRNTFIILPSEEENHMILSFVQEKTNRIDLIIDDIYSQIQRLSEYRIKLISDVVTGKVDVRNININTKDASDAMDEGVEVEAEITEIPENETEPEKDEQ